MPTTTTSSPTTPAGAPVTSAPVTSASITSASITSAPVTSAPVTSAPCTPAPVTSAPNASAPATPAASVAEASGCIATDGRDLTRRSAVISLMVTLVGAWLLWTLAHVALPAGYTRTRHVVRAVIVFSGTLVMFAVVTHRTTGLRRPERADLPRLAIGAIAYLLPTAVAVSLVLALGGATLHGTLPAARAVGQALFVLGLVLIFEAIPEELIFRNLVQTSLTRLAGPTVAVLGQALLFAAWGLAIGAATTPDRFVYFVGFSIVQGLVRLWGRSVLCTIAVHAAFQWCTQWMVGSSWNQWQVHDPQQWFAGALVIPAAAFAPFITRVLTRRAERVSAASRAPGRRE